MNLNIFFFFKEIDVFLCLFRARNNLETYNYLDVLFNVVLHVHYQIICFINSTFAFIRHHSMTPCLFLHRYVHHLHVALFIVSINFYSLSCEHGDGHDHCFVEMDTLWARYTLPMPPPLGTVYTYIFETPILLRIQLGV